LWRPFLFLSGYG